MTNVLNAGVDFAKFIDLYNKHDLTCKKNTIRIELKNMYMYIQLQMCYREIKITKKICYKNIYIYKSMLLSYQ